MILKTWLKQNTRQCCANILVGDDVETHKRGDIPKSWLDMEVEDVIDEGILLTYG